MNTGPEHSSVLLVGASRGLGLALAEAYARRGSSVVATVRDSGSTALDDVGRAANGRLDIEHLDITSTEQIKALRQRLDGRTFDLLFVVAGVINTAQESVADVSTDEFVRLMVTNALSPMRVVDSLEALVEPSGTVAVMSSLHGSIANNQRGEFDVYRASKAALNQLMRSYSARRADDTRTYLLITPGWVRTALGGPDAPLSVGESVERVVRTVDAQRGHRALRFLNHLGEPIPW